MSWKSENVKITENMVTMTRTGLISGMVTYQKRWRVVAPSMAATSYSSGEMVCRPASRVMP